MSERLDYYNIDENAMKGLVELEKYVANSGLESSLYHLVKLRASQINGCAYCVDMHTKDARKEGETEQRLYGVSVWREAPYYTDRERAALEWTEALTLISQNNVPDEIYNRVAKEFDEKDMMALTMCVIAINGWNRLAIPFRTEAGTYDPK